MKPESTAFGWNLSYSTLRCSIRSLTSSIRLDAGLKPLRMRGVYFVLELTLSKVPRLTRKSRFTKHQTRDSLRIAWYAYMYVSALECRRSSSTARGTHQSGKRCEGSSLAPRCAFAWPSAWRRTQGTGWRQIVFRGRGVARVVD